MVNLKKEYDSSYFWILIIGFILGLWAALIVWGSQRALKNSFDAQLQSPSSQTSYVKNTKSNSLNVFSPQDESIESSNYVMVSGNAGSNSKIVVLNADQSTLGDADSMGKFNIEVPLTEGVNDLTITAFSDSGEDTNITRTVIYSKESIE